jgi:two-component system, chemotaxis family, protein-glutamate methylesterase/glutaminase
MTNVLICEDSQTYAAVLAHAVEGDELHVAAVCASAEEALELLPRLRPDVVTMDLELPGMSGLAAVEEIMSNHPVPIMVLSSLVAPGSDLAAAALAAGALDAIGKDNLELVDRHSPSAEGFRERLKVLAGARVIRHPRARLARRRNGTRTSERHVSVIGISASTGGPPALAAVLRELPESFPIPILVVQHMSAGFTEGLVRWLDGTVQLPVGMAGTNGGGPGVWVAPEEAHLVLDAAGHPALDRSSVPGLHRPSADMLFGSLAETAGSGATGVVLTGMGRDGADGLEAIRRAGGLTIAQDEASSAVFGMPRAAAEAGAEMILAPSQIGAVLSKLVPAESGR